MSDDDLIRRGDALAKIHWLSSADWTKSERRAAFEISDAICALPAATGWQDIATSPKDDHRSFPTAADGRPMPPMGDDLMIAGLGESDARFVARQLAHNGLTLTDWREIAIKAMEAAHRNYMIGKGRDPEKYTSKFSLAADALRTPAPPA